MQRDALRIAACFFACLLAITSCGQSTPTYTPKPEDFRIVDGKLYNVQLSKSFTTIGGRIVASLTNGIILQKITEKPIYASRQSDRLESSGNFLGGNGRSLGPTQIGTDEIMGANVFIRNFSTIPKSISDSQHTFRALPVGTFDRQGKTLEMFDYGLPNTPENRMALTNSVVAPKP